MLLQSIVSFFLHSVDMYKSGGEITSVFYIFLDFFSDVPCECDVVLWLRFFRLFECVASVQKNTKSA